ncbi:DUF1476 domain-containing protein [Sphingobium yanoikuyae]|uniref:DUF1476 domain-containing protein n=1 Tax=Sphingobium yanoikuyae TaxID=13690 RepID=UPI000F7E33BC|nr:DUF1476 domain-containing protein [Sphingobium yanoikuyae]RSU70353.1 DUF1476 domain-containing protein [Sphingomonas sp. S-NIH.Pt3_0716]
MTMFDDRERGEEAKFVRDEDLRFRIQARRNRLLGEWAAERMELSEAETDAYAATVVQADFEEVGDDDVVRKVLGDMLSAGIPVEEAEVRTALRSKELEARRLVTSQG